MGGGHDDPYPGGLAEATVVGQAQEGDLMAFELLVRRYQGPLFRLALRMLGDRGQAEDVVQDVMVQVWRKLGGLTDLVAFRRWVYQIATRRCLDVLRSRRREATTAVPGEVMAERADVDPSVEPSARHQARAELAGLEEQLHLLPAGLRVCWVLRELHGLAYEEVAEVLELPVSTVRGRIARARQQLTRGMAPWR